MISVLDNHLFSVRTRDHAVKRMGLRDLLCHAHELADLTGRTPTGRLALMRLCVALLEDVYRPQVLEDRRALLEAGRFDSDALEAYFAECDARGPRFLLDDREHPFMQMPYCPDMDEKAEKPAAALFNDLPAGNNHTFIEHRPVGLFSAEPGEALEGMLETYMFCTAGAQDYPSGVNNMPPVYCLVNGGTLFETLVLNMVSAEELPNNVPFGEGRAPWRTEESILPKQKVPTVSFLEAFTWQPRRLTLAFDEDQRVRRVYLQQGKNFIGDGRWRDPWVPCQKGKDGADVSVKPVLGRQLWRDAGAMLSAQKNGSLAPVPVVNAPEVWEDMPDRILPVEAVGLITNQASYIGTVRELLRIPEALLEDEFKVGCFKRWIALTEEMYSVAVKIIAGECSKPVANLLGGSFLQDMREAIFGEPLESLVRCDDVETMRLVQRDIGTAMVEALRNNMQRLLEKSGTTIDNLKHQNTAEGRVLGYCVKRLKEEGMR